MSIKDLFSKFTKKKTDSVLNTVKTLETKRLPIPDVGGSEIYVRFSAKKLRDGSWDLSMETNCKVASQGLEKSQKSFKDACKKYKDINASNSSAHTTIETALLVLHELEYAHLFYGTGFACAIPEPKAHYKKLWDELPDEMQGMLTNTFETRKKENGVVLQPLRPIVSEELAKKIHRPKN